MARQASTAASESSSDGTEARRAALVLAVSEYTDPQLRQLRSPAGDADELGRVLGSPDLGGFDVTVVLDARANEIRLAVETFLTDCGPNDLALVYLSCHGLVDVRRRLYFAATDTVKDRLASTGVEARWLLDQLEECRARRQLVILDCCFSGAFATSAKGNDAVELGEELLGQGRGRVVLTASRATEYSFEGKQVDDSTIPGSVFTAALATGIRTGAADNDGDGYITVDDAYAYAFDEMRSAGAQQTPQRWLYGAEGDIVLARSPTATRVGAIPTTRPGSPASGDGPPPLTRATFPPGPGPRRPARATGRRRLLLAGVAAVVVAAATAGVVWRGGSGDGEGDAEFSFREGRYVDTSVPWHVTVSDQIPSVHPPVLDKGCTLKVRDQTRSGRVVSSTRDRSWEHNVIWQFRDVGSFYLDFPRGCLVNAFKGAGETPYPVTVIAGTGDSLAWNPSGPMEITATESSIYPCGVIMVDTESGGMESVTLESADDTQTYTPPPNTSSMYMSLLDQDCLVTVRDAVATGS